MKTSLGYSFLYLLAVGVLYATSIAVPAYGQGCRTIETRKEIRDMTDAERNTYINAIITLQSGSRPTRYDRLSQMHYNARGTAHGWAWFFSWHRAYLMEFQRLLRTVDSSIVIPYWDWSYDSQAPELAPIWQSDWYGGNGRSGDRCVTNGKFSNYRPYYPQTHCLQRQWDNGDRIYAYYSPQALRDLIDNSTPYDTFRQRLEGAPHGQVHVSIGFDMSTMYSPNDPIFFLHHCFIDKLWADWQAVSPSRQNDYGGQNADGTPATLNDRLTPLNYNVRDVMNTRNLCYVYAPIRATSRSMMRPVASDNSSNNGFTANDSNESKSDGNSTVTTLPADGDNTPAPDDRTELVALRSSKPVPEHWLRMNRQDVQKTRETEARLLRTTKNFNSNNKQVSSAALINRGDIMNKLIKEKGTRRFTLTNGNKRTTLSANNNDNADTLVNRSSRSVSALLKDTTLSNPLV